MTSPRHVEGGPWLGRQCPGGSSSLPLTLRVHALHLPEVDCFRRPGLDWPGDSH